MSITEAILTILTVINIAICFLIYRTNRRLEKLHESVVIVGSSAAIGLALQPMIDLLIAKIKKN